MNQTIPAPAADASGDRAIEAGTDFFAGLHAGLAEEVGVAANAAWYKAGQRFGRADMAVFLPRIEQEVGAPFADLDIASLLERWSQPLMESGWGRWRFDFSLSPQGLIVVDLTGSPLVAALPGAKSPVCHLHAGLFAAVFSTISRRELHGLELCCQASGAPGCRFVVSSERRIATATQWRDEGVGEEEIMARFAGR